GADAAGDNRHVDALGLVGGDQAGDVEVVVDHQQVGALAAAQGLGRLVASLDMTDLGAVRHRHFHSRRQLSAEPSDHQEPHGSSPLRPLRFASPQAPLSSVLMISVMVTPSRSSTTTTSPRATSRLLTKMSIASPTLRSSSRTLPRPSLSSWATDMCALPSTAEMFTGTSNTGVRSLADLSWPSSIEARAVLSGNSSSGRSLSAAIRTLRLS